MPKIEVILHEGKTSAQYIQDNKIWLAFIGLPKHLTITITAEVVSTTTVPVHRLQAQKEADAAIPYVDTGWTAPDSPWHAFDQWIRNGQVNWTNPKDLFKQIWGIDDAK